MPQKGLVLFDACVLEARYLAPILRSEICRDFCAVVDRGYEVGVLQQTLLEVWAHAKLGTGNSAIWTRGIAYPGSIDGMIADIRRECPEWAASETAWLWFNLAEEWWDRDDDHDARLDPVRAAFLHWKQRMERFCLDLEAKLIGQSVRIVASPAHATGPEQQTWWMLQREVGLHSLIPSEDLAWILESIALGARAVVTSEKRLALRGRLSLGFNQGAPSFVHPDRLQEALEDEFTLATYPKRELHEAPVQL